MPKAMERHSGGRVRESESQRDRETERQRVRESERQRDRETETQRDRETERQRDTETQRQRDRETERQRGREAERQKDREGGTEGGRERSTEAGRRGGNSQKDGREAAPAPSAASAAPVTDTRREGERLETQQPDRTACCGVRRRRPVTPKRHGQFRLSK